MARLSLTRLELLAVVAATSSQKKQNKKVCVLDGKEEQVRTITPAKKKSLF
eukprot:m.55287 g.55287  ORF g.55287 m.55287 type:complete len:51 (+) comp22045_c0_seq2:1961-2113(+)